MITDYRKAVDPRLFPGVLGTDPQTPDEAVVICSGTPNDLASALISEHPIPAWFGDWTVGAYISKEVSK